LGFESGERTRALQDAAQGGEQKKTVSNTEKGGKAWRKVDDAGQKDGKGGETKLWKEGLQGAERIPSGFGEVRWTVQKAIVIGRGLRAYIFNIGKVKRGWGKGRCLGGVKSLWNTVRCWPTMRKSKFGGGGPNNFQENVSGQLDWNKGTVGRSPPGKKKQKFRLGLSSSILRRSLVGRVNGGLALLMAGVKRSRAQKLRGGKGGGRGEGDVARAF